MKMEWNGMEQQWYTIEFPTKNVINMGGNAQPNTEANVQTAFMIHKQKVSIISNAQD